MENNKLESAIDKLIYELNEQNKNAILLKTVIENLNKSIKTNTKELTDSSGAFDHPSIKTRPHYASAYDKGGDDIADKFEKSLKKFEKIMHSFAKMQTDHGHGSISNFDFSDDIKDERRETGKPYTPLKSQKGFVAGMRRGMIDTENQIKPTGFGEKYVSRPMGRLLATFGGITMKERKHAAEKFLNPDLELERATSSDPAKREELLAHEKEKLAKIEYDLKAGKINTQGISHEEYLKAAESDIIKSGNLRALETKAPDFAPDYQAKLRRELDLPVTEKERERQEAQILQRATARSKRKQLELLPHEEFEYQKIEENTPKNVKGVNRADVLKKARIEIADKANREVLARLKPEKLDRYNRIQNPKTESGVGLSRNERAKFGDLDKQTSDYISAIYDTVPNVRANEPKRESDLKPNTDQFEEKQIGTALGPTITQLPKEIAIDTVTIKSLTIQSLTMPEKEEDGNASSSGGLSDLVSIGGKGGSLGDILGKAKSLGGKALNVGSKVLKTPLGLAGVALAGGYAADAGLGVMGVGKDQQGNDIQLNERQDDANWNKMSFGQKVQSGAARGLEKLGRFVGLGNMANQAASDRISSESAYLGTKGQFPNKQPSEHLWVGMERKNPDGTTSKLVRFMDAITPIWETVETSSSSTQSRFSEGEFQKNDPNNFKKYEEYKNTRTKELMNENPSIKGNGKPSVDVLIEAQEEAEAQAKAEAVAKFKKEIDASGAGKVTTTSSVTTLPDQKQAELSAAKAENDLLTQEAKASESKQNVIVNAPTNISNGGGKQIIPQGPTRPEFNAYERFVNRIFTQ